MTLILPCIWFFVFGTVLGSFFNVLIDRLPEGRDFIFLRSACTDCGTKLKWYDLIPVFSYLVLGGRCRYCGAKLSPWYLISELSVGLLSLFAYLRYSSSGDFIHLIGNLLLWFLLYIVAVMDFESGFIMDIFPLLIAVCGIGIGLAEHRNILEILLGGLTGLLCFGILYFGTKLILKKEGLGLGDVFLLGAAGCWIPWQQVIISVFLTAYISLVFILYQSIKEKGISRHMEFPLGPSICITAFVMNLYGDQIRSFLFGILLP